MPILLIDELMGEFNITFAQERPNREAGTTLMRWIVLLTIDVEFYIHDIVVTMMELLFNMVTPGIELGSWCQEPWLLSSLFYSKSNVWMDGIAVKHTQMMTDSGRGLNWTWNQNHEFHETCLSVTFYCTSQFTPNMKANAEQHLLSSLVWVGSGVVMSQHCL